MRLFLAGALSATALVLLLGSKPVSQDVELAPLMLRFQVHADKLWFAGTAENWPLATFYGHELQETLQEIEASNLVDRGVAVSKLAGPMFGPTLESVRDTLAKKDSSAFRQRYEALLGACNACHAATRHPFIKIKVPTAPGMSNQQFAP